jgi:Flp pilus assembly protein TadB
MIYTVYKIDRSGNGIPSTEKRFSEMQAAKEWIKTQESPSEWGITESGISPELEKTLKTFQAIGVCTAGFLVGSVLWDTTIPKYVVPFGVIAGAGLAHVTFAEMNKRNNV